MTTPKIPEVYYSTANGSYWMRVNASRFLSLNVSDLRLHLRKAGLYDGKMDEGKLNQVEQVLTTAHIERHVDYAGPLAGHRAGVFTTSSDQRVLVTSEPAPAVFDKPEGKADCPFIERYLDALLGPEQLSRVLWWLHYAAKSLRRGDFMPGQLLVLSGDVKCGKSFFHVLVTELLGGRMGKPYLYLSGKTNFNADLAEAESLVMEDERASTDIRSRLDFKASIKQMCVNESMHIHGKGSKGIVLPTFRRMTLSCNSEPESLAILPPMDDDALDKMILVYCSDAKPALSEDRKENVERLRAEIPALRVMLSQMRTTPKAMKDPRFGVAHYAHAEILEATNALAPESRLLSLIDSVIFDKANVLAIDQTSDEIEKTLRGSSFGFAVDKLLSYSSACGSYLARLQKRTKRITSRKVRGTTHWEIKRP